MRSDNTNYEALEHGLHKKFKTFQVSTNFF